MDGGGESLFLQEVISLFHRQGADLQIPGKDPNGGKGLVFRQFTGQNHVLDGLHDLLIDRGHRRSADNDIHENPPREWGFQHKQYITVQNCCQLLYGVYFKK